MEIWKDIPGYENYYQVSNEGNVRSLDREFTANSRWGRTRTMRYKGRVIKQTKTNAGYLKVVLSKEGIQTEKDVHRIVYEAFNGDIPPGMQVNHIDECKTNNALSNLNLMTPRENTNYGTGIDRMRESRCKRVFQYKLNGEFVAVYNSTKEAAEKNGYDQATISACCRGKEHCKTYKGYIWSYRPL